MKKGELTPFSSFCAFMDIQVLNDHGNWRTPRTGLGGSRKETELEPVLRRCISTREIYVGDIWWSCKDMHVRSLLLNVLANVILQHYKNYEVPYILKGSIGTQGCVLQSPNQVHLINHSIKKQKFRAYHKENVKSKNEYETHWSHLSLTVFNWETTNAIHPFSVLWRYVWR